MDYHFVTPDKLQNLNRNQGDIFFSFNPNENTNFFESSLVIKLKFDISKNNKTIPSNTKIPSFKKYFVYYIFNELELIVDRKKFSEMKYPYEYIRSTQVFSKNPRDSIQGLSDIPLTSFEGEEKLVFNIPLRYLIPEFKNMIHSDQSIKDLTIKLRRLTEIPIFTDLNDILTFNYSITNILLKIPKQIQDEEPTQPIVKKLWKSYGNYMSISPYVTAGKGDIPASHTNERPINYIAYFMDKDKQICKGLKSIKLMINSQTYPSIDVDEEEELEHYYEMYLRHVDYIHGEYALDNHKKNQCVWSYEEFKKHPIYFFILPKIKPCDIYSVKFKCVFEKGSDNKIEEVFYMFNYVE